MSAALVLATLMLAMAFYSAKAWKQTRDRRRLIAETPTSRTGDVREGHVEIKGKISPISTLRSPLRKKEVVYSKWEIREERKLNRISAWTTIHTEEKRTPFFLEDETGKVRIVPDKAELLFKTDATTHAMHFQEATPEVLALLEQAGLDEESIHSHNIRVVETYLEPGDELYVCGKARLGKDGTPVIDSAESLQISFLISDHKEEVILAKLARAERSSAWGAASLLVGSALFYVIGVG